MAWRGGEGAGACMCVCVCVLLHMHPNVPHPVSLYTPTQPALRMSKTSAPGLIGRITFTHQVIHTRTQTYTKIHTESHTFLDQALVKVPP